MGLFKKNKAKNPEPVKEPEIEREPALPKERIIQVGKERNTLDSLVMQLEEMQENSFLQEMEEAAVKNEKMVDENINTLNKAKEQEKSSIDGDGYSVRLEQLEYRAKIEEGLYILPEELSSYKDKIDIVTAIFKEYSATEACLTGADEIDELLGYYIEKLKEALKDGQKLKADACWSALKYAVCVAHDRKPEGRNDEEKKKVLERRKRLIETTYNAIVSTTDRIYGDLFSLNVDEKAYSEAHSEYSIEDKQLDSMPQEYKDDIETLGFSGVIEKYPTGHPIRGYVDRELSLFSVIVRMNLLSFAIERKIANINKLKNNLKTLQIETEKSANNEQGLNYNDEEVAREINRISTETLKECMEMYNQQLNIHKMNTELTSRINEATSNQEWGAAGVESRKHRQVYKALEKEANKVCSFIAEETAGAQINQNENEQETEKITADMG